METGNISQGIKDCIIPAIGIVQQSIDDALQSQKQLRQALERLQAETQVIHSLLEYNIDGRVDQCIAQRKRLLALQKRLANLKLPKDP
jgi:hypothetical protein